MLYSQVRRIHWRELFDAQHGFMVESLGADAEGGGMAPKQVITQVRESIRDVFDRELGARAAGRHRGAARSSSWRTSRAAAAC